MRTKFDEQLETLNNMLTDMGIAVESAIAKSIKALKHQDIELAQKTIRQDQDINQKEKDIEAFCLRLLLQHQPVARDLRLISATLKMITDMERIGDQAADIAEITLLLAQQDNVPLKQLQHIPEMAKATAKMVTQSIDAFVKEDIDLAIAVKASDDEVDHLFEVIRNDLIELISLDSENGEVAMDLLMIAKYFERIGDHAVNIAEWVIFAMTGSHKTIPAEDNV